MKDRENPLLEHFRWPAFTYFILEMVSWLVTALLLIAAVTIVGVAVGPVADWAVILYAPAVFLGWRFARAYHRPLMTLGIVCAAIISVHLNRILLIRIGIAAPFASILGAAGLQLYYCARSLASTRRVLRGRPHVLYCRSSMADTGPFFGYESNLFNVLGSIGPGVMLSTRRLWRRSSAIRLYWVPWQKRIAELMRHSALVVFFVMPRRGYDHGDDLLWDELEDEAVKELLPSGRVLLLFREHWANKALTLINMSGTVEHGRTSLMTEVFRAMQNHVTATWPENLGRARFLWFSPGARPQSLGVFPESLGTRRRFRAELAPILEFHGVKPSRGVIGTISVATVVTAGWWIAYATATDFELAIGPHLTAVTIVAVAGWVAIIGVILVVVRRYYTWWNYEYDNFVLHSKYH